MRIVVFGKPQPGGSKRAFARKRKDGTMYASVVDANPKAATWKSEVAGAARLEMSRARFAMMHGPLALHVAFHLPRPQGHYRKDGSVRPGAPMWPAVKPDLLKLTRLIEDALSGICYRDDALIVTEYLRKLYSTDGSWVTEIEIGQMEVA